MLNGIHRYVCSASAFRFSTSASVVVGCFFLLMFTSQLSAQVSADKTSVDFGSIAVGSSAPTQNLNITIPTGVTLGSFSVATQGAVANPDFTSSTSGTTCTSGTSASCIVSVAFQPTAIGRRLGAVVLVDQSTPPNTLNIPLAGIGTGPLVAFGPGIISTFAGTYSAAGGGFGGDNGPATSAQLNYPNHVAFDGAGNVYITDSDNDLIRMVTPAGTITTFAGIGAGIIPTCAGEIDVLGDGCLALQAGLLNPTGVAVDGAGNVYIADYSNNLVRMVAPSGVITIVAGTYALDPNTGKPMGGYDGDNGPATSAHLNGPGELAFDRAGNLYIADIKNYVIRQVTPAGIITTVPGTYSTDGAGNITGLLGVAEDLAFDGSGNLYIADSGLNVIWELSSGNLTVVAGLKGAPGGYSGDGGLATNANLSQPQGVRVDAAGNLYIADTASSVIRKVTATNGVISTIVGNYSAGPGYSGDGGLATNAQLNSPAHLELDGLGNLYIAETANNVIRKVDVSDAPALSFLGTPLAGVTLSQDITVLNLGTDPLVISQITTSTDFSLGGPDTSCSSSKSLAPAASCILGIVFNPTTTATELGSAVLADNTLNNASATQTIALKGSGTLAMQTITFPNPGTQTFGTPATLTATASSGLTVTYTVTSGPATVTASTVTFTGPGSVTIEADQAGNNAYSAAAAVSVTFTVSAERQSITFPNPGTQTFGVAPITLQASASSGLTVTYKVTSGPASVTGSTVTFTGPGTVTIEADQAGNTTYSAAAAVSVTFAVSVEPQSITFPNPGAQTFGVAPITLQASATSGLTVSYKVTSGPATVTGSTVTFTGAGTVIIEADQSGNTTYSAAAPASVTFTVNASPQTITFPNPGTQNLGVAPITLQASATSGLPVSYQVTSGSATVSAGILTITGVGSVTVQATQSGGTNYLAATPVNMTFTVLPTPDYTVTASSSTVSMTAGTSSTVTLNLTSTNYAGTVSFVVNTTGSAITASAPSVTLTNGGTGSTTLTITTTTSAANHVPSAPWKNGGAVMLCAVVLGAPFTFRRKKRATAVLLTAFAISLVGLMMACGGGSATTTPTPTPKAARPYTLTVTTTGTGAVANPAPLSISLSVQ